MIKLEIILRPLEQKKDMGQGKKKEKKMRRKKIKNEL